MSLESFVCESCEMGKHHRATYRRQSLTSSRSPFDLVHCDIWGPTQDVLYYIIFFDDFSRVLSVPFEG